MNMMKELYGLALATAFMGAVLLAPHPASAAPDQFPGEHLDWGGTLNSGDSACPVGDRVINVVRKISNGSDNGFGTNTFGNDDWAILEFVQNIQVDDLGGGDYCATLKYQGSLETVGNESPAGGGADSMASGIVGTFQGGVTLSFSATTFNPDTFRTKGNLGKVDQNCTGTTSGIDDCNFSSTTTWISEYFDGVSGLSFDWYGWVYHAGNNGSWINGSDGDSGDITGD
ncbi:MAG: hypothetical protein IH905_07165 [Proteobacteria bacterium]|nr:hypothetical protein [Pseudomonadota bacterium]